MQLDKSESLGLQESVPRRGEVAVIVLTAACRPR